MAKKQNKHDTFWVFLLVVYSAVMLWLLFGRSISWVDGIPYREQLQHNANLTPFYTIKNYIFVLRNPSSRHLITESIVNLGGNVLLFIPAGWLLPKIWPQLRKFFVFLGLCAGVILLVETTQLLTLLGNFDVDDVILNLFGMSLGFGLFKISSRR